ncbi:hypothetical protein [Azospirillum brasilense]|uniref:hypothetical protein n=1 Tax=Azospirillum brasilense TaxID=192 RepID=UPI001EDC60F6|nr:hypothetical protein [Azospirillum brasilense]UKJ74524.1 hypothetical protein H1Q64_18370 [Azospirillum brasilense]
MSTSEFTHSFFGRPVMAVLNLLGLRRAAAWVHDVALPVLVEPVAEPTAEQHPTIFSCQILDLQDGRVRHGQAGGVHRSGDAGMEGGTMIEAMPPLVSASGAGVCLKLAFHGHEISILCDDSCGAFDTLRRVEVRVFRGEQDVTEALGGPWHDADELFAVMKALAET